MDVFLQKLQIIIEVNGTKCEPIGCINRREAEPNMEYFYVFVLLYGYKLIK